MVALGPYAAGLFSKQQQLVTDFNSAGAHLPCKPLLHQASVLSHQVHSSSSLLLPQHQPPGCENPCGGCPSLMSTWPSSRAALAIFRAQVRGARLVFRTGPQLISKIWRSLNPHDTMIGASRFGGACTAAAFLMQFVNKGVDWAHIDIAGPSNIIKGVS